MVHSQAVEDHLLQPTADLIETLIHIGPAPYRDLDLPQVADTEPFLAHPHHILELHQEDAERVAPVLIEIPIVEGEGVLVTAVTAVTMIEAVVVVVTEEVTEDVKDLKLING